MDDEAGEERRRSRLGHPPLMELPVNGSKTRVTRKLPHVVAVDSPLVVKHLVLGVDNGVAPAHGGVEKRLDVAEVIERLLFHRQVVYQAVVVLDGCAVLCVSYRVHLENALRHGDCRGVIPEDRIGFHKMRPRRLGRVRHFVESCNPESSKPTRVLRGKRLGSESGSSSSSGSKYREPSSTRHPRPPIALHRGRINALDEQACKLPRLR